MVSFFILNMVSNKCL